MGLFHFICELAVVAKGVDRAFELIGGLLLLSPTEIRGVILFLVQGELNEDPRDLVVNSLVNNTAKIIRSGVPATSFLILQRSEAGIVVGLGDEPAVVVSVSDRGVHRICRLSTL